MRIGRKEAILALVATMIPWMGRRAGAQVIREKLPLAPAQEVADLQRRVAALETQLANQVAFTKDASGNLSLRGNINIMLEAGANLTMRASGQTTLGGAAGTRISGATVALN